MARVRPGPAKARLPARYALAAASACALLTAAAPARAGSFEARLVRDGDGVPVAGATVSIVGTFGSARTDGDGRFVWPTVPSPPFLIIVVLSGGQLAPPVVVEAIESGASIAIQAFTAEAVTVLGAAPSVDHPPASAVAMQSAAQIESRAPENLMQALETVPGISQVSEGHAAVPAVRGLARGRTLLLLDGGRVTSERRVGPGATFLDPSAIEGIDIARGPGSVAYGSDALGGVISVRTRRAEPGSPFRGRFTGTLGAGTVDRRGSVEISRGLARGGVLVHGHVRSADDYASPRGTIADSGWEDRGFLAHVTHDVGSGHVSTVWQNDYARDVGRPRNNSATIRFVHPLESSHRFTASYDVPDVAGFRKMSLTGFLGSQHQRTEQQRHATALAGSSLERSDLSAKDFHVRGAAERLVGAARVAFGLDVNGRYALTAFDTIRALDRSGAIERDETSLAVGDARRTDVGGYVEGESALGRLVRLSGGFRGDRVTTANEGGFFGGHATANAASSGFGALTVLPLPRIGVTVQISRGFRDPMLSDRYFRGPSGRGFITGNPELGPERSVQIDVAGRYVAPGAHVAAYWYRYRIDDLIERFQAQPDFFAFRNRGRARLQGVEIEARLEPSTSLSVELGAHLARGRAGSGGTTLDDVPADTISVLARRAFGDKAYAHVRVAHHGMDNRPGPSEVEAPAATLVDLAVGRHLTRQLEVRGTVRNLLDAEYYASPDPRWVLAPGRSFSMTAVIRFD